MIKQPCTSNMHISFFSWHLYQILLSVGYSHLSEYYASYLHTSYAAQLEAMGLWQWAVFVLMHIQDHLR